MTPSRLTQYVHTRYFGVGVGMLAFIAACIYFIGGYCTEVLGEKGLALPSANEWISTPFVDFVAGIAGAAITATIMLFLCNVHNVLRSISSLYMALYAFMQLATPDLYTQFYTGTLLAMVVPLCIFLLFSCYHEPDSTKLVFVIFLILSFLAATQYCFIFYIPAFLIGLGLMRILNIRSIIAALLGIITPWWILFGFGLINPTDVHMPTFASIFSIIDYEETFMLLITIGVTVFIMFSCYMLNLMKTIAYNAQARAINGTFSVVSLITVVSMCIDYHNIISYVPLLNFCAAKETTHYLSTHRADKSFIVVYFILAFYATMFVCQSII